MKAELAKNNAYMKMVVNLLRVANNIDHKVTGVLKDFGITHVQFNVLRILELEHPKSMSVNDISLRLFFPTSDVSRMIDRLVNHKLISRNICPKNRRKLDITITDKGLLLIKASLPKIENILDGFYNQRLTIEERDNMLAILSKLRS